MQKTFFILFALIFYFNSEAQDSILTVPKRVYTTKPINMEEAPVIDGTLDDKAWNLVDWSEEFIEFLPDENTLPTEKPNLRFSMIANIFTWPTGATTPT